MIFFFFRMPRLHGSIVKSRPSAKRNENTKLLANKNVSMWISYTF